MPHEISAGAVVVRKTKSEYEFLLLQYSMKHWDFAKGHMEEGEEEMETARREIQEETGISRLKFIDGFRETIKYFYRWKGKGIFKIVIYFLAQTRQKSITLSYEHIGYAWLPYNEALKRLTYKTSKDVLKKGMKTLRTLEH